MTQPDERAPNFILIDPPKPIDPATEALKALSIDTPAKDIDPERSPELTRLFNRMYREF